MWRLTRNFYGPAQMNHDDSQLTYVAPVSDIRVYHRNRAIVQGILLPKIKLLPPLPDLTQSLHGFLQSSPEAMQ